MASFGALRGSSTADFGQRTNVAWVKRYLAVPDEDYPTWGHEVPIFSVAFQHMGEDIEIPLEIGSGTLTGYKFMSPPMVNFLMHNKQIQAAEDDYALMDSLKDIGENPANNPKSTFDPLFQTKEKRITEAWYPCGVQTVAPMSMDEILGTPGLGRSGYQVAISGEIKCRNYWGICASGVHYLFFALKMKEIHCNLPDYNVTDFGTPAVPLRARQAKVTHVPEWVAISCWSQALPEEARQYEFEGRTHNAEVVYVGKCIYSPDFDVVTQSNGLPFNEVPMRDESLIGALEHIDILVHMIS